MRQEALVKTIANGLSEAEAKALGDKPDELELVNMLADTLVHMDGKTLIDTLCDVLAQIKSITGGGGYTRQKTARYGERSGGLRAGTR